MRPFEHASLLYEGLDDLVVKAAAFVEEGLSQGEPVMVLMPEAHLAPLRDRLGPLARDVTLGDMTRIGRNPSAIISRWRDFVGAHPGQRVRGIGEPVWAGRPSEEIEECHRHEALINLAFQEADASILCPYDVTALDPDVIAASYRTHPLVVNGTGPASNDRAMALSDIARPFTAALPEPRGPVAVFDFGVDAIGDVRAFVARRAREAGLSNDRVDDLVVAVNELATNTVRYGGDHGLVRSWAWDGRFVVEVRDEGYINNALAGRLRPQAGAERGYGLWLVNQLCDFVQLRSSEKGNVVRLQMEIR